MTREIILLLPPAVGDTDIFLQAPWSERWTRVTREAASQLQASLGIYVRLNPGMAVPHFSGTGAAIWTRDIEQLDAAGGECCWSTVIFEPTGSAALDAMGLQHRGLTAKHALKIGHVLTAADIQAIPGGIGLSEKLLPKLIGLPLCYDLKPGEPITFGMIET